jgi:hypothetical protein
MLFKAQNVVLPQEILDTIIPELAEDRAALRACSLASPFLRPASQRLLFSSICIRLGPVHTERNFQFHTFLEGNTRISSYVKTLHVCIVDTTLYNPYHGTLHTVLPYLNTLILDNCVPSPRSSERIWESLKAETRDDLLHIMRSPRLQSLVLGDISLPGEYLRGLSQLRELDISDTTPLTDSESDRFPSSPLEVVRQSRLESLCVRSVRSAATLVQVLQHTASRVPLTDLRIFKGRYRVHEAMSDFQRILELSAKTLVDVDINLNKPCELHR